MTKRKTKEPELTIATPDCVERVTGFMSELTALCSKWQVDLFDNGENNAICVADRLRTNLAATEQWPSVAFFNHTTADGPKHILSSGREKKGFQFETIGPDIEDYESLKAARDKGQRW